MKKNKESSGEHLSGRTEVKEKKGSTLSLSPGGERKSSHTKRIMHGVTKVSTEETDNEKEQGEAVELLLACKDLWEDDRRGGPGSSVEDDRVVLRAKRCKAPPSSP